MKTTLVIFAALVGITSATENFKFVHCCQYNELLDHDIKTQCHPNETSDTDHKEKFKARTCHLNCIAREMKLLEGDSLSVTKFEDLVTRLVKDAEGQKFYLDQFKKCEQIIEEKAKHHKGKEHDDPQCSKKVSGMMMCMGHKVALECPDAKKVQSPECDKQREFFQKMQEKHDKHHGKHE